MIKLLIYLVIIFEDILALDHWETAIFANDEWKYIVPDSELPGNWNTDSFNDSSWDSSEGGFGYSDNDDGTIIEPTISVFIRKTFQVIDKTKLAASILSADYDDGYIAYLNGHEIGRSYNLPEPGTFVAYNHTTSYDHEASLYILANWLRMPCKCTIC